MTMTALPASKEVAAAPPPRVSAPAVVPFANVPGMATGASLGGPCTNFDRFIFGTDTAGETLACVAFGGIEGQWVSSAPLQGVQQIGAMCTNAGGDSAAQTADGRALVCVDGLGPGGRWRPRAMRTAVRSRRIRRSAVAALVAMAVTGLFPASNGDG